MNDKQNNNSESDMNTKPVKSNQEEEIPTFKEWRNKKVFTGSKHVDDLLK